MTTGTGTVSVLYVGGVGRSGSTLLDRMLGQLPDYCSIGELFYLWERVLPRDQPCSCGEAFSACPFWTEVGRRAFGSGGWESLDREAVLALKSAVDRSRHLPALVAPRLFPAYRVKLAAYTDLLTRVYRAVLEVSGARIVVDSTKLPSTVYALRTAAEVDLRVVQLVRDPRGVAYSWTKKKSRGMPGLTGRAAYMPIWSPRKASRRWVTTNLLVSGLKRFGVPVVRVRYEDLVDNPRRELVRVLEVFDTPRDDAALSFVHERSVELGVTHTVAGNPNRFDVGRVDLRQDDAWRERMQQSQRRLVERLTRPLAIRYGYLPEASGKGR